MATPYNKAAPLVLLLAACEPRPSAPTPDTSVGARPRADTPSATPPTPSPSATPPAPSAALASGCDIWRGATSVVASSVAGRADFSREFRYDFASASLSVNDSDPFASGNEAKVPRVTKKTLSLAPDQKKKVEEGLRSLCPSEADLKQRCAPGGCVGLEILGPSPRVVQHHATALAAQRLFEPLFPEIRQMNKK